MPLFGSAFTHSRKVRLIYSLCFLAVLTIIGGFGCAANKGNTDSISTPPPGINTKFVSGAKLSPAELYQIIALANECGIQEVGEVETGYMLPTNIKSISQPSHREVKAGQKHSVSSKSEA